MPNYLEILRLDSLNHSQRTIESTVIVRGTPSAAFCKQQKRNKSRGRWMMTSPTQSWRRFCSLVSIRAGADMWSRTIRTFTGSWQSLG